MDIPPQFTVNLTKEQKINLVPFFATWLTYFVLYMPFWGYPPQTLGSAFFKILPILSLCYYVISASRDFKGFPSKDDWLPTENRARHFVLAQLCSVLGDACLVWRELLFVPGLIFFAVAQVLYIIGMKVEPSKSRTKDLFFMLGLSAFLFIKSGVDSFILTLLIALYCVLLFTMGWKATARYETEKNKASLAGCVGALMFLFSDFLIATDKWCFTVPFAASMVMSSYYGAQLCLALSTTKNLK